MTATLQRPLPLMLHQRTVLVTSETARAALGVDTDTIMARVDSGELRWVWDISAAGNRVAELRFWVRELIEPTSSSWFVEEVIPWVIGSERERFRAVEVGQLFCCSRPLVMRLVRSGELNGEMVRHTQWITRVSLEGFLRRRLLNA